MSSDFLNSLLVKKVALEEELEHVEALIAIYESKILRNPLKLTQPLSLKEKQTRVRGVLAAARKAVDQLAGPFDKNQLLAKLVEIDEELVHKKITGSNIRNALRLLTQAGVIRVEKEATATTCATYVKTA
jgi:hypothetical protein